MDIFKKYKINITQEQQEQFKTLNKLFVQWNSTINLSSIRDEESITQKHFIDSLLATKYIDFNNKNILDIGAGGGFPCLPLAIIAQNSTFSALDSVGKKMKAVQDMADKLKLKLKTFHGRIEDFGQNPDFREKFDIVTARALAPWPILLEYALPFVKKDGIFIAYQGPSIQEDLISYENLENYLGGAIQAIHKDQLETPNDRYLIIIKKEHQTKKKYPRKNGIPRQEPLKN